jgi:hypothetical protein
MTLVLAFFNRFQFDKSDVSSGCRLRGERACQNKSDREARIAPAMPMTAARKIAQLNCMIAPESLRGQRYWDAGHRVNAAIRQAPRQVSSLCHGPPVEARALAMREHAREPLCCTTTLNISHRICGTWRRSMLLSMDFRRQARVCARLAEECEDPHLAARFRSMAVGLTAKAEDFEDLRSLRYPRQKLAAA